MNFSPVADLKVLLILAAAAAVAPRSSAATKHCSFSNGYPTTTRQTGATVGATTSSAKKPSGSAQTKKAEAKELVGKVVRVDSGDVIWVTPTGGKRTKVRLLRTDAPEQGQNFGVEAKKFLFDLVNAKEVTVRYRTKDRAGAVDGTVYLQHEKGVVDVNLTMVQNGCAWCVAASCPGRDSSESKLDGIYAAAQESAKAASRGLWNSPRPVSPAEWRKSHK